MGIGDVTRPLVPEVIKAMHAAVEECAHAETFHGYGPEHGYPFLRKLIAENDYKGLDIDFTEVFISDGANSDLGNIGDIFSDKNTIGIITPVYPVYVDTNLMRGREIKYIDCTEENEFMGDVPDEKMDIIYLCFPNNPTGVSINRERLQAWVDYALRNKSVIIYDSAYEVFIRNPKLPHSIYEIEGAKECAIEIRSFSKTAGFTGVRCGYTVVPNQLGNLNARWDRRQGCKFNGASYISQRGAAAIYTPEGHRQIMENIDYYMENVAIIRESFISAGLKPAGGGNAPYVWTPTPNRMDSWEFFDICLNQAGIVITPGCGFGKGGEGNFRISAFNDRESVIEAMSRMKEVLRKL